MNQTPGKSHLTALDILIELRCWLADKVEMQAEPAIVAHLPNGYLLTHSDCVKAIDALLHQLRQEGTNTMRLPNPYSLEETLEKLRHCLTTTCNEDAQVLLEKAVAKARDDPVYAKQLEATLLQGSTVEIRECLGCFGDYVERSRDAPPYYPHHDAVNGIDCALYTILFTLAHPAGTRITPASPNPDHQRQYNDLDIPAQPIGPPHQRWPFSFQGVIPMSAFMIDRQDYLAFAVQLHRFCNAPMPPHYTLELLRTLWWMPPADTNSTWTWRVDRLVRLMMLANRRAVWHRYQLGRQQDHREPHQHGSTKLSPLKPAHRYHQALLTDSELVALYKFTCCALYQSSEWSGIPEQAPRLVKVIQQLQQALAQDVLARLSLWEQAPWGEM